MTTTVASCSGTVAKPDTDSASRRDVKRGFGIAVQRQECRFHHNHLFDYGDSRKEGHVMKEREALESSQGFGNRGEESDGIPDDTEARHR